MKSFILSHGDIDSIFHQAVVVFYGPHYGGERHYGRIDHGLKVAEKLNCPIIICGDGCNGEGVQEFVEYAKDWMVPSIYGHFDPRMNTRGDAHGASVVLSLFFPYIREVNLVTDWYHTPRSLVALKQAIDEKHFQRMPKIMALPVFEHIHEGFKRLPGELRGVIDYIRKNPQRTFGAPDKIGKPGLS